MRSLLKMCSHLSMSTMIAILLTSDRVAFQSLTSALELQTIIKNNITH